ncbi:MAG: restriction endonuclease [Ardenticatenia bacterium]|nr:restriction endonuclease [Ardenticatenia bacterium]
MLDEALVIVVVALVSALSAWHARGWYAKWRRRPRRRVRRRRSAGRFMRTHISPAQFERLVAELFRAWGWRAEITGRSGDRGVDIRLWRGETHALVQCKRYRDLVPPSEVRAFYGVLVREKADVGFFVTTGRFSGSTRREAAQFRPPVLLIDGRALLHYLYMNNVPLPKEIAKVAPPEALKHEA